jgi:Tfp pilus assembly protein PilO
MMNSDRRNRLILVVLGTLAALAAIYSLGISSFRAQIDLERSKLQAVERKLQEQKTLVTQAGQMGQEAEQRAALLADLERRMPSGDIYFSLLARLELLGRQHGIRDLKLIRPTRSAQAVPTELAKLGYVGIRGGLQAVGHYEQIGLFVAALENELPFMRVTELRLDAVGGRILVEDEGSNPLGFQMMFDGCATEDAVLQ